MAHNTSSLDFDGYGHCGALEISFEEIAGMIGGSFF